MDRWHPHPQVPMETAQERNHAMELMLSTKKMDHGWHHGRTKVIDRV